jgi:hypothetical protein
MESVEINYWVVPVGTVLSMVIGYIWYGPLFGKKWMEINGVDPHDMEGMKKMQKSAGPLYGVQFIMTLFQILVLAYLVAGAKLVGGLELSVWIFAAFIMPTLAGAVMWTSESGRNKWTRFIIQSGYQLIIFIVFGLLLQFWK